MKLSVVSYWSPFSGPNHNRLFFAFLLVAVTVLFPHLWEIMATVSVFCHQITENIAVAITFVISIFSTSVGNNETIQQLKTETKPGMYAFYFILFY